MLDPLLQAILCPILIGRDAQVAALTRLLDQACSGHGQIALISGEAGIGKSRLVVEAKSLAASQGFTILQGNCFEPDRVLPYAPLLDLLRNFCSDQSPSALTERLRPYAADLVKLLPELTTLWPDLPAPPPADPEQEKRCLFQTLTRFFVDRHSPLIIIEDLHWCDATTLEFLTNLVRRLTEQPCLLLLTYRSDEVDDNLRHFLATLDRTRLVKTLNLTRLPLADTQAMIAAIFAQQAVRQEFADAIYHLTDGNPFFIEETLNTLVSNGDIYRAASGWTRKQVSELHIPVTVTNAVQRRVQQVSANARRLLSVAAVIGRRFNFDLLLDVLQIDEPSLLAQIKELMAVQLVVEESADHFAFRHALTRQAIYAQLLARERRPLHRAIGQVIERRYADNLVNHLGDLAQHFLAAGEWAQAQRYAQDAAERAQALFAPQIAIEYFTQALEAATHLDNKLPVNLLLGRGQLYELVGQFDRACADYEQALATARGAHDQQTEWRAHFTLGTLWSARDYQRAGDYLRQALSLARQMDDSTALAHTLYRLGNWHANMDQQREALQHQQAALTLFEQLGDKQGLAMTLDVLGMTNLLLGDMLAAAQVQGRALALFRQLDDRTGLCTCLMVYALRGLTYLSDATVCPVVPMAECLPNAEEALHLARTSESKPHEAGTLTYFALVLGGRAAYTRAFDFAQQGFALAVAIEHPAWQFVGQLALGAIYADLLEFSNAQQHFAQAQQIANRLNALEFVSMLTSFLAPLCAAMGELGRAEALLEQLTASLGTQLDTYGRRRIQCARVELHLARGEASAALALLDAVIAATPHASATNVVPRLWRLRGEALVALGRWGEAEATLVAAVQAAQHLEAKPQAWRSQIILGKLYRSQRRSQDALAAFAAARTLILEVATQVPTNADLRANFTQRALALIPAAPLTPLQQARQQASGLTARERGIAILVAEGKSNRQIAETLIISQRTVEVHVGNIMNKLGISTRTQIAVWVTEQKLSA